MSHAKNKIKWCLNKAKLEIKEGKKHRGLLIIKRDEKKAKEHIAKAEHNLEVTFYLHRGGFSDWCSSSLFYTVYHCFFAILAKNGYESRNQECTFAVIEGLIEENKISISKSDLEKISSLGKGQEESTVVSIREEYQYNTKTLLGDKEYNDLLNLAKKILDQAKEVIEE
jgi:uncharacterized protein (UPF0332 family)